MQADPSDGERDSSTKVQRVRQQTGHHETGNTKFTMQRKKLYFKTWNYIFWKGPQISFLQILFPTDFQEEGEKYLMLKKRYYPNFEDDEIVQPQTARRPADQPPPPPSRSQFSTPMTSQGPPPMTSQPRSSSPSLLDEVMANYQPLTATLSSSSHHQRRQLPPTPVSPPFHQQQQQQFVSGSFNNSPSASQRNSYVSSPSHTAQQPPQQRIAPPPYRGPPVQPQQQPPYRHPPPPPPAISRAGPPASDLGLPLPSDYGLPAPRHGVFHPPSPFSAVPSAITDSSRSSPIGYGLAMSNAGKNLCKRFETANDHLIEFHLIEIVIFHLIESFN